MESHHEEQHNSSEWIRLIVRSLAADRFPTIDRSDRSSSPRRPPTGASPTDCFTRARVTSVIGDCNPRSATIQLIRESHRVITISRPPILLTSLLSSLSSTSRSSFHQRSSHSIVPPSHPTTTFRTHTQTRWVRERRERSSSRLTAYISTRQHKIVLVIDQFRIRAGEK